MPSAEHRTPEQVRADLRARVRNAARAALETACDAGARSAWASFIGVSHGLLDRALARDGDKSLHVADALAAPQPVRHALAQLLIGDAHAIAELPDAIETPDDLSLLATLVRKNNAAVEALISACADGSITADEGASLVEMARSSLAVTASVMLLGQRAVKNRSVKLRVHAGGTR